MNPFWKFVREVLPLFNANDAEKGGTKSAVFVTLVAVGLTMSFTYSGEKVCVCLDNKNHPAQIEAAAPAIEEPMPPMPEPAKDIVEPALDVTEEVAPEDAEDGPVAVLWDESYEVPPMHRRGRDTGSYDDFRKRQQALRKAGVR